MRSFATMAPGFAGTDAAAVRVLHLQSRCGQPQPGHPPPLPVEYTSLASLLAGFFFDTRGAQDVRQAVVALVASVLVNGTLRLQERHFSRPRPGPGRGVVHGEGVGDGVGPDAREALRHLDGRGRIPEAHAIVEVRRFDDERVALPVAARV